MLKNKNNKKKYIICKKKFEDRYAKDKKYSKVRDRCYYTS